MTTVRGPAMVLGAILLLAVPAHSAEAPEAPYEKQLLRLAEVLGSIHYLRNVCGEEGSVWRDRMNELLVAEAPSPERREKLVASFNRGYRAFAATYTSCTEQATRAVERYMKEGATLANDIAFRFGE